MDLLDMTRAYCAVRCPDCNREWESCSCEVE